MKEKLAKEFRAWLIRMVMNHIVNRGQTKREREHIVSRLAVELFNNLDEKPTAVAPKETIPFSKRVFMNRDKSLIVAPLGTDMESLLDCEPCED